MSKGCAPCRAVWSFHYVVYLADSVVTHMTKPEHLQSIGFAEKPADWKSELSAANPLPRPVITEKRVSDDPEPDAAKKLELMILERAVIETAVKWGEESDAGNPEYMIHFPAFVTALKALLKVRQK